MRVFRLCVHHGRRVPREEHGTKCHGEPRSIRRAAWLRHGRPTCITPARPSTAGWTASHDGVVLRVDGLRHGQDVPPTTESQQRAPTDTPHIDRLRGDAGLAVTADAGSLPGKECLR